MLSRSRRTEKDHSYLPLSTPGDPAELMKRIIGNVTLGYISFLLLSCENPKQEQEFHSYDCCPCFSENNLTCARNEIDDYISTLDPDYNPDALHRGYEREIDSIKNWLESNACIHKVVLGQGIVKTGIPQKCYNILGAIEKDSFAVHMDLLLADTLKVGRMEYTE